MIRVRYIGPKPIPLVLNTPIPFISRSERTGEVTFNPEAELEDEWANFLLTDCAGAFERVGSAPAATDQAPRPLCQNDREEILKYVGKRFTGKAGKWNAATFIKRHRAKDLLGMRKLQIGDKVVHWELVALALADVTADQMDNSWNPKGTKGKQTAWNKGIHATATEAAAQRQPNKDAVPEATEGVPQSVT